jgi:hypothetical protein
MSIVLKPGSTALRSSLMFGMKTTVAVVTPAKI